MLYFNNEIVYLCMTMKQDTKTMVYHLMVQRPDMRDSDELLIAYFWKIEMEAMGYPSNNTTAFNFLKIMSEGRFTSGEHISRMRRKIQETNPELRGAKYQERQANQKQVKKKLGYK